MFFKKFIILFLFLSLAINSPIKADEYKSTPQYNNYSYSYSKQNYNPQYLENNYKELELKYGYPSNIQMLPYGFKINSDFPSNEKIFLYQPIFLSNVAYDFKNINQVVYFIVSFEISNANSIQNPISSYIPIKSLTFGLGIPNQHPILEQKFDYKSLKINKIFFPINKSTEKELKGILKNNALYLNLMNASLDYQALNLPRREQQLIFTQQIRNRVDSFYNYQLQNNPRELKYPNIGTSNQIDIYKNHYLIPKKPNPLLRGVENVILTEVEFIAFLIKVYIELAKNGL